ncbi:MAG: hypothetical protein AB4063_07700 [Crocosphaera sp.]
MRPLNFKAIAELQGDRKTSRRSQNFKAIAELQGDRKTSRGLSARL